LPNLSPPVITDEILISERNPSVQNVVPIAPNEITANRYASGTVSFSTATTGSSLYKFGPLNGPTASNVLLVTVAAHAAAATSRTIALSITDNLGNTYTSSGNQSYNLTVFGGVYNECLETFILLVPSGVTSVTVNSVITGGTVTAHQIQYMINEYTGVNNATIYNHVLTPTLTTGSAWDVDHVNLYGKATSPVLSTASATKLVSFGFSNILDYTKAVPATSLVGLGAPGGGAFNRDYTVNGSSFSGISTSITVDSTVGASSAGRIWVTASGGQLEFTYSSTTATSFDGLVLQRGTSSWTIADRATISSFNLPTAYCSATFGQSSSLFYWNSLALIASNPTDLTWMGFQPPNALANVIALNPTPSGNVANSAYRYTVFVPQRAVPQTSYTNLETLMLAYGGDTYSNLLAAYPTYARIPDGKDALQAAITPLQPGGLILTIGEY
jgi:hypothetical protein